ncbi:hypothetical protein BUALT_Bualt13G0047600 [Buddleja alternifolia]|uniref:Chromo domain-containing protein n=1 Tax=Buddleja alternifolia TaxID=168488 RepID=A0AAV6WTA1_9LAMI|nr:hypothetical protein BUALT_Bualt13G0047600 [Buddleja alternifolia]
MAEGTRIVELQKDVDGLKLSTERTEKSIEELRSLILDIHATIQHNPHHTGNGGQGTSGDARGESQVAKGVNGWQNGYQKPTKCSRVEFPEFFGDDLRDWAHHLASDIRGHQVEFQLAQNGVYYKRAEGSTEGRLAEKNHRAITRVLVKWFNSAEEDSSWEDLHEFQLQFTYFNP